MKEFKVRLTFTEEVLGTCSNDPNIQAKLNRALTRLGAGYDGDGCK